MNNKNNLPETSLEAYKALHPETQRKMYDKIIEALKVLGTATYEELSDFLNCQDRNQISRRLKEMEGLQMIWKPGTKRLTKRNRNAFVYQLTGNSSPKTETEVNYAKGDKTATDYANDLIRSAQNHGAVQTDLFPTYQKILRDGDRLQRP